MYELKSATKTYTQRGRTVTALASTSLTVEDGEFVALIGPSGSGKTTFLSLLGGMLSPTAGRVLLAGESMYDMSVTERARLRRERIGFVFQAFNLVSWLTARENVQVPLSLGGVVASEQVERAAEALRQVGLSDRLHHRPAELSQGQQQRVALARALANDPDVILADEPTGNLDPAARAQVMEHLNRFHADGRTIVMVTHDSVVAKSAQRQLQLVSGVVQEVDPATRAA